MVPDLSVYHQIVSWCHVVFAFIVEDSAALVAFLLYKPSFEAIKETLNVAEP